MKAPKFVDNKTYKMVDEIKENSKISMISSSFILFVFEELNKELSKIDEFRFGFTEPTFV